jgi:hypothetical protein
MNKMIIFILTLINWATTTKAIEEVLNYSDRLADRESEVMEIEFSFLITNLNNVVAVNKNNKLSEVA